MTVRAQELQEIQPSTVREIAGRWEVGLRAVMGLAGITGLIGAPLAANRLAASIQILVGALLGVVLVMAGSGLLLTMAAAYGSASHKTRPATRTQYQRLRQELAERGLRQLLWGRRLAVAAVAVLTATVVTAWVDPPANHQDRVQVRLMVTSSSGVVYCGQQIAAANGGLALQTASGARIDVPFSAIQQIETMETCQEP
jgi:hypothetical protein